MSHIQKSKKRLLDFPKIKRQSENQLERLARMKSAEVFPEIRLGNESKRNPGAGDRMASDIVRRLTYEDEIAADLESNLAEMDIVRRSIKGIPDRMEQDVLWFRYVDVDGYSPAKWREVALQIYNDDSEEKVRAVTRLHGRALEHIKWEDETE